MINNNDNIYNIDYNNDIFKVLQVTGVSTIKDWISKGMDIMIR